MSLTAANIDLVCNLVEDLCGICLDESKSYLIENRLADLMNKHGCSSYEELVQKVRLGSEPQLANRVVDAITTNETLFFRDQHSFEALRHKALPELIDAKQKTPFPKRLRIWSAACSTGQEPYSLAILLKELIPDIHSWDVQIYATDISDRAITQASRAIYSEHEVERGLTPIQVQKYFHRHENQWQINDDIRSLVSFEQKNLLEPLRMHRRFDIVFCRNVAIYFSPEVRAKLFHDLSDTMITEGYMFVGAQEMLRDLGKRFEPQHHCRSVFYRPNMEVPNPVSVH